MSVLAFESYGDPETPEQVIARLFAAFAAAVPGWRPSSEGSLDVALLEEFGRESADLRYLALVREPARVFRAYGTSVVGLAAVPGAAATLTVRLTLTEIGATAPDNLVLVGTTADGVEVTFTTDSGATAGVGESAVEVTATATDSGDVGNGVPPGPLVLATSTAAVLSATAVRASTGGTDPETAEEYLDRLVQAQSLTHRGFVLAADAAILARSVPGVHRALAIDNYDADTGNTAAERTITVVPVDDAGTPVAQDTRRALLDLLDSLRETNFVVRVTDPTYSPVHVVFTATTLPGRDPGTVYAAMLARAYAILDPGAWGGGAEEPPAWRDERRVRFLDLAAQLDAVEGVDYVDSLTLNGGSVDVTLSGVAALPASRAAANPSTVVGLVSAPEGGRAGSTNGGSPLVVLS